MMLLIMVPFIHIYHYFYEKSHFSLVTVEAASGTLQRSHCILGYGRASPENGKLTQENSRISPGNNGSHLKRIEFIGKNRI